MFGKKNQQAADIEIFTVYDSKSEAYDLPALAPNKNMLIRDVLNMLKDPAQSKNKYLTNAEDYSIFSIGTFDKTTGLLTASQLTHVANFHDLRAQCGHDAALSPT